MALKKVLFLQLLLFSAFSIKAQPSNCQLKQPAITIHFGSGNIRDLNTATPPNYQQIRGDCPGDGYYTYTPYTLDCFYGQWFTLKEDHTPGDISGNMMLVNSSYYPGRFLTTTLPNLKGNTVYEFAVWLMNVCNSNSPCPSLLLPDITVQLQTQAGKTVAQFRTGEIARREVPKWTRYHAFFTTPASETVLTLIMVNNNPGGCGNDFALDDITLRECVKPTPVITTAPVKTPVIKRPPAALRPVAKKAISSTKRDVSPTSIIASPKTDLRESAAPVLTLRPAELPPSPPAITTRTNSLVKQIETEAGEVVISLYDNGEIDGDTISVYHNNILVMTHAALSQKPLSLHITVDAAHPHHELIMVAENLGAIPPNTSVMIVTAGARRYEVFISSNEQKNAKVIFDLKK